MPTFKNRVSVVIVTHNSLPLLEDCLQSLKLAVERIDHELIIVDNYSSDLSLSVAAKHFPRANILVNRRNLGFAKACNQGAGNATGEYLLFLNPDVQVDQDGVENLLAVFSAGDRVGLATARLRHPSGTFQPTCRKRPTLKNVIFSRGSVLSGLLSEDKSVSKSRYTLPDYPETTIVDAVAGTMTMVRRDLFDSVGGFDDYFFMYMEDTDLSVRLTDRGYANVFAPGAGGIHHWRHGSDTGLVKRAWYHHLSVWKYFHKHHPGPLVTFILPLLLGVNFLLTLLSTVFKRNRQL